ncbi:hypothetical protein D3C72_1648320 [compost metagenome]
MGIGARIRLNGAILLFQGLGSDNAIALHHVARDLFVSIVRGVRDHEPAILPCKPCRFDHGLVVVACDAHHFRAQGCDGRLALFADIGVQHDYAATADASRGRRQRPAMIAVGCADDSELGQCVGIGAMEEGFRIPATVRPLSQDEPGKGDRGSESLEAADGGSRRLILQIDPTDAQMPGKALEPAQRRWPGAKFAPCGQPLPALRGSGDVHDVSQRIAVGCAQGGWVLC